MRLITCPAALVRATGLPNPSVWIYVTVLTTAPGCVVIVSVWAVLPPAPVAVQVQLDGYPTQAADAVSVRALFTASDSLTVYPVPEDVHTRDSDVALLVLQLVVNDCPATGAGLRVTLIVGLGVAGAAVVIVSVYVVLPPAPVAVQVQLDGYPTQDADAVSVRELFTASDSLTV